MDSHRSYGTGITRTIGAETGLRSLAQPEATAIVPYPPTPTHLIDRSGIDWPEPPMVAQARRWAQDSFVFNRLLDQKIDEAARMRDLRKTTLLVRTWEANA